jgi:NitT/TauT family transport system substrate-binding protein
MHLPGVTRKFLTRYSGLLAIAALFSMASPGCKNKPDRPAAAPAPITVAHPTNISAGLALIGIGKGYFSRGGAPINPIAFESGKAALDLLLAGQADVAVVAETPIARAILSGGKFKILAAIEQSGRDVCIVARKDRGILAPKDLKDRLIGYSPGTSGHYFLDTFLLANQIGPGEARLIQVTPLQARTDLLEGRLDAIVAWDPHSGFLADALGDRASVFRDEFIYTQIFCVVARPEFIRDHPNQVQTLLEGLLAARDLLSRAPGEAEAIIAQLTKVDSRLVAKAMAHHEFDVRLDQALLVSLEEECRWLLESGAVPARTMPDIFAYLHLQGLLPTRPHGVQVIRAEPGNYR